MNSIFRKLFIALAAALASLGACANTYGPRDVTDLWYNPAESGWGFNLIQQFDVAFGTLFVYGADNRPHWFVASELTFESPDSLNGPLYEVTTGPPFDRPWTGVGQAVSVGSLRMVFNADNTAVIIYTVNGFTVSRSVQRQTWRSNRIEGIFIGALSAAASGCAAPAEAFIPPPGTIVASHQGNDVSLRLNFTSGGVAGSCTFNGPFTPSGRTGSIAGSYSCTQGSRTGSGTFQLSDVEASLRGMTSGFSGRDAAGCTLTGYLGGVSQW